MARQRIVPDEPKDEKLEDKLDELIKPIDEFTKALEVDDELDKQPEEFAPKQIQRPKDIDRPSTKDDEKISKVHRTLAEECAAIAGISCGAIGFITKHEHWYLDDEDSTELGKAIASAIPSLPKREAEKMLKRIPMIRLIMTGGVILGTRVYREVELQKLEANQRYIAKTNAFRNVPNINQGEKQPEQPPKDNLIKFEIPGVEATN